MCSRTIRILISFLEKRRWKSLVKVSPIVIDYTCFGVYYALLEYVRGVAVRCRLYEYSLPSTEIGKRKKNKKTKREFHFNLCSSKTRSCL